MKLRLVALIGAATLPIAGCVSTGSAGSSEPNPADVVRSLGPDLVFSMEVTSWGRIISRWELHPDRTLMVWEQDFETRERKNERTFRLAPETYEKAVAVGARLRSLRDGRNCRQMPTDGPTSTYSWKSGVFSESVSMYGRCYVIPRGKGFQPVLEVENELYEIINAEHHVWE